MCAARAQEEADARLLSLSRPAVMLTRRPCLSSPAKKRGAADFSCTRQLLYILPTTTRKQRQSIRREPLASSEKGVY